MSVIPRGAHGGRRLTALTLALGFALLVAGGQGAAASGPASGPAGVLAADEPAPTAGATAQAAPDLVSFGIAPAGAERADERPSIDMTVPPGSVVYEHVAIINQGSAPLELAVYAADVTMADGVGLAVRPRAETSTDAGSWIAIDGPADVTVPPQTAEGGFGYTIVPLTITVPADAEPGDHLGGVVASLTTAATGRNVPSIDLEQRVTARLHIRVDGEIAPGLRVSDVRARWTREGLLGRGAATVTYTLRNTGNVRLAVEPGVTVEGPFGVAARSGTGTRVDELLPGGEVRLTTTVDDVWALGRQSVTVHAAARAAAGLDDPGLGVVSGSTALWTVPWLAVALLALLALLVVRVVVRRRRRRATTGGPSPKPAPDDATNGVTAGPPAGPAAAPTTRPLAPSLGRRP